MPYSISVNLEHSFKIYQKPLSRLLQGWFNHVVAEKHPSIADQFHEGNTLRPYTISTIFPLDGRHNHLYQSEFRITFLNDELGKIFLTDIIPVIPQVINLQWMAFRISGYDQDHRTNRWAGFNSYADLCQQYALKDNKKVKLIFCSPTTFRKNKFVDYPLPDPSSILKSYYDSWNAFSPVDLAIDCRWLEFAQQTVVLNRIHKLKTERWVFAGGERGAITGFTGEVEYSLLPPDKTPSEFRDFYLVGAAIFRTLCAYSFYCGTGYHTTIGLGQTFPKFIS